MLSARVTRRRRNCAASDKVLTPLTGCAISARRTLYAGARGRNLERTATQRDFMWIVARPAARRSSDVVVPVIDRLSAPVSTRPTSWNRAPGSTYCTSTAKFACLGRCCCFFSRPLLRPLATNSDLRAYAVFLNAELDLRRIVLIAGY